MTACSERDDRQSAVTLLEALASGAPAPSTPLVGAALRRLGHDLNGPLAAIQLETDGLRCLADSLRDSLRTEGKGGHGERTRAIADELAEIADNLDDARRGVTRITATLHRVGQSLAAGVPVEAEAG